ncbi:hypothetical protein [Nocardia inohanensis]|uniref:hypothetical protein n=1 Tax=Nocardia inohanensis TaxID=209246 RepID=UPI00082B0A59|nr:hypothetical protein [Nocardia inohanensis]
MAHNKIELTADSVRDLLRDQHPDLEGYPLRLGARGWDNQLWRLGDDLAVRFSSATPATTAAPAASPPGGRPVTRRCIASSRRSAADRS